MKTGTNSYGTPCVFREPLKRENDLEQKKYPRPKSWYYRTLHGPFTPDYIQYKSLQ